MSYTISLPEFTHTNPRRPNNVYWGAKAGYRARGDEVCGAPCLEMTDMHNFRTPGLIRGISYYHRYISEADITNKTYPNYGAEWSSGTREREKWYCVETHHVLNTPKQGNGIYQNWLDGKLVSDQRNVHHRNSASFDIDHSVLITYVGGSWVAEQDMDFYYDDWAVSDKRIGCL